MLKIEHKIVIVGVWLIVLATICIISANFEVNKINGCVKQRIRIFNQEDFTWTGIVEQVSQGKYQPKCL
jgi:hypothetical protein